jgi:hypothetical protein
MVRSPFLQEGLIVYGLKKESRWSPPLGASVALKIGKNTLEAKKSYTIQSREGGRFYKKNWIIQLIAYFCTPQKIFKCYSVAFRVTR